MTEWEGFGGFYIAVIRYGRDQVSFYEQVDQNLTFLFVKWLLDGISNSISY